MVYHLSCDLVKCAEHSLCFLLSSCTSQQQQNKSVKAEKKEQKREKLWLVRLDGFPIIFLINSAYEFVRCSETWQFLIDINRWSDRFLGF